MISRRIPRKPANDNYRRLANYIAGAGAHPDEEKVLHAWCAGCWAGEDYEWAIQEVQDTQSLNQRTSKEKTYHLIVSFRPEDEGKLGADDFRAIEAAFAEALGFGDHQRHCAVHQNTGNLHLHVAYNMIHPERLTRHEPYRDFLTRDRLCRELERRYGMAVDNGRGEAELPREARLGEQAATMEAHSGQQSFESYARSKREALLNALDALDASDEGADWTAFHAALAVHGLTIAPHGAGFAIRNAHGHQACKASAVDRRLAKGRLEARLGSYEPPRMDRCASEKADSYGPRPNARHPDPSRGQLFKDWERAMAERRAAFAALRDQGREEFDAVAATWGRHRRDIEQLALTRRDRLALLRLARERENAARRDVFQRWATQREALRTKRPYVTWAAFREGVMAREWGKDLER